MAPVWCIRGGLFFCLCRNGVAHLENLDPAELARDKTSEFAFVFPLLRLKGMTGSPGRPSAIR